jgi:hypothetical protein
MSPKESLIGGAAAGLSRAAAERVSRRSFVGKLGRFGIVAAGAGVGLGVLSNTAWAVCTDFNCDCAGREGDSGCGSGRGCPGCEKCGHSLTCKALTGIGGACPSGTRTCGSWTCNCGSGTCGGGVREWVDCCPEDGNTICSDASSCRCLRDDDGCTHPTCCYRKDYAGGSITRCAFIRCRFSRCL